MHTQQRNNTFLFHYKQTIFSASRQWDAFSIPELRNFLRILDKEEEEQKEAIARRYLSYRRRLEEALRELRGPP